MNTFILSLRTFRCTSHASLDFFSEEKPRLLEKGGREGGGEEKEEAKPRLLQHQRLYPSHEQG
jgi:hypothetical protein